MSNPCPPADVLSRYAAGNLTDAEASTVVIHVGRCDACMDRLANLDGPHDPIGRALRGLPATPSPASPPLARAIAAVLGVPAPAALPGLEAGTVVGGYRVAEELGRGGMGRVYRAAHPRLDQEVALKVLRPGADSAPILARFEAERQALARMDHPNIARVLDGGATADGQPFFAMELVKGVAITRYCDDHRLGLRDRLALFVDVCRAVQHAHQKGIIHRDLKPSNVLVAEYDGKPAAKVIDFGVAKPVDGRSGAETEVGVLIGTPESMSPEQADLSANDIDTRTDVYALGGLLYELLTGDTPFERSRLRSANVFEVLRIVREEEPPPPSSRLAPVAAKAVRGDLDWITLKALEKDRGRRYETAAALADDVERHLNTEPVLAGPPSTTYRLRKFLQRHKSALAVAGLALTFLVLLGAGAGWIVRDRGARQALSQREVTRALDDAEAAYRRGQLADAHAAVQRADGLLATGEGTDDLRARFRQWQADLKVVENLENLLLARTALKGNEFDKSGTDAAYRTAFREYGLDVETLDPSEAAERIRSSAVRDRLVAGLDDWVTFTDRAAGLDRDRLIAVAGRADDDGWRARLRDALQRRDGNALIQLAHEPGAADQPPANVVLLGMGLSKAGAVPQAVELLRQAQRRHPDDFWINHHLATALSDAQPAQAIGFYRAALARRPDSPGAFLNLGVALRGVGQLAEAEGMYREALRLRPGYAMARSNLSAVLRDEGRLADAEREALEACRLDAGDPDAHHNYGMALYQRAKFREAEAQFREGFRLRPDATGHNQIGIALHGQGRVTEAIAEYRRAIEKNPEYASAHQNLGRALTDQNKLAEAEAANREALRIRPEFAEALIGLATIRTQQKRLDDADTACQKALSLKPDYAAAHQVRGDILWLRGRTADAIEAYRRALELNPQDPVTHYNFANRLKASGKTAEAEAAYREAIRRHPAFAEAYCNLGLMLVRAGRYADAVQLLRRGHELGCARAGWRYPSAQWVRDAEQFAALDARLPAILAGEAQPASAAEWLQFARLIQQPNHGRYATSARFFTEAFAADPKLVEDVKASQRYNAACAAALAAAGQGRDEAALTEADRARLRRQAVEWLRADLAAHAALLDGGGPAGRTFVQTTLSHWQRDTDLAGVRDAAALAALTADERTACTQLWADVEALLAKSRAAK